MGQKSDRDLQGRCTCGSVRYRLHARPMFVHCCHCRWCQRETGSAFALNALIESDHVAILSGSPASIDTPSNSGRGQKIIRCPRCQVALWSHYAGAGEAVSFIRVGTLDTPHEVVPDIHIYTDSKVPWVALPAEVPAVPEYYALKDHWPPESIRRLKAARERHGR